MCFWEEEGYYRVCVKYKLFHKLDSSKVLQTEICFFNYIYQTRLCLTKGPQTFPCQAVEVKLKLNINNNNNNNDVSLTASPHAVCVCACACVLKTAVREFDL